MHVAIFDKNNEWCGSVLPDTAEYLSDFLEPGTYDLFVWGKGIARQVLTATVNEGQESRVSFQPVQGTSVQLQVSWGPAFSNTKANTLIMSGVETGGW